MNCRVINKAMLCRITQCSGWRNRAMRREVFRHVQMGNKKIGSPVGNLWQEITSQT